MSNGVFFFMGFMVGVVSGFVILGWLFARIGRSISQSIDDSRTGKT